MRFIVAMALQVGRKSLICKSVCFEQLGENTLFREIDVVSVRLLFIWSFNLPCFNIYILFCVR